MKVVHLSTNDSSGGAARAAMRLNEAMLMSNIDSSVFSLTTELANESIFGKLYSIFLSKIFVRFKSMFTSRTNPERGLYSYSSIGIDIQNYKQIKEADIIYIHWINHFFLSLNDIENILKTGKQIIICMHDMWFCTGGCHHSFECTAYTVNCFNCPMFIRKRKKSSSSRQLKKKQSIFSKYNNLKIITPSIWLSKCASSSIVFNGKSIFTIANTLNVDLYRNIDKSFAREILGLPIEKKIICFGADSGVSNPYKGWHYMQQALQYLVKYDLDVEVLVFGSNYNKLIDETIPYKVHFTGKLVDDYSLIIIYNSIDLFVFPSIAEAFGQVASEAMSCGAPVVGFDVGGIPDLIETSVSGYLARYKDSEDLAKGINSVLTSKDYDILSDNARKKVVEMCGYKGIVQKHRDLWNLK